VYIQHKETRFKAAKLSKFMIKVVEFDRYYKFLT